MTPRVSEWEAASGSDTGRPHVEMRRNGDRIEVRDSRDEGLAEVLSFTLAEFEAWLDGARKGEFDHLA